MSSYELGAVLDGKYEILKALATGGMGSVYLVHHLHLHEMRVVKVLRQDVAADEVHRMRFLREARLATQIKHPNVAILYDYSQLAEGGFYMVWEHVDGAEVGVELAERGPFPVPLAIELGIQALRGLETIHTAGMIHRDLSPDNLMLTRDLRGKPRIKIIDLGLAKHLAPDPNFEITQAGTFMGKLRYCSPEQADSGSENLDRRTDLYSLGLVLYEMICGLSPFEQGDRPAFVFQRLTSDPLPLRGRNPAVDVPPALDQAVLKALERDRDKRYPDSIRFIEALEQVASSLRSGGVAPSSVSREPVPASVAGRPPGRSESRELSSAERKSLLQQIDQAANRVRESTQTLDRVQMQIDAGQLAEARRELEELEASHPATPRLPSLRRSLEDAEQREGRERSLADLEGMLTKYLKDKQLPLAELALDSLLEIDSEHPKKAEWNGWLDLLRQELKADQKAQQVLAAGREALEKGKERAAKRKLDALRKLDPEIADLFEQEMEAHSSERRQAAALEGERARFDELLGAGDLAAAEGSLERMASLGVTRVSLDFARRRLEEQAALTEDQVQADGLEHRFRERLAASDFQGARDVAQELGKLAVHRSRAAEMFAEVARQEGQEERQNALRQGEKQVDELIRQGSLDQARLALGVLVRLDPQNRRRSAFEARIAALAAEG